VRLRLWMGDHISIKSMLYIFWFALHLLKSVRHKEPNSPICLLDGKFFIRQTFLKLKQITRVFLFIALEFCNQRSNEPVIFLYFEVTKSKLTFNIWLGRLPTLQEYLFASQFRRVSSLLLEEGDPRSHRHRHDLTRSSPQ